MKAFLNQISCSLQLYRLLLKQKSMLWWAQYQVLTGLCLTIVYIACADIGQPSLTKKILACVACGFSAAGFTTVKLAHQKEKP